MTSRYNNKVKAGRGFTLQELKAAGINKNVALSVGICVDHRRQNSNADSLQENVARLKAYQAKLIVFPRRAGKAKAGDATAADTQSAAQLTGALMPIKSKFVKEKARAITAEEKSASAYRDVRMARSDQRLKGKRAARATAKAIAAEQAGKKAAKGK